MRRPEEMIVLPARCYSFGDVALPLIPEPIASKARLRIPVVQNRPKDVHSIFGQSLVSCDDRVARRGAGTGNEDDPVRATSENTRIGYFQHGRRIDHNHVEMKSRVS